MENSAKRNNLGTFLYIAITLVLGSVFVEVDEALYFSCIPVAEMLLAGFIDDSFTATLMHCEY